MLEDAFGRLVSGALWGLGAGVVVTLTRDGAPGLRSATRGLIKGYLAVSDRVQTATAEVRESFDDLAAEARSERQSTPPETSNKKTLVVSEG